MRRRIHSATKAKSSKPLPKSTGLESTVAARTLQREALDLKVAGWSHSEIADELGISPFQVTTLLFDGLEEYKIERDEAAKRFVAVTTHRYELIHRKWWPLALGYTEKVEGPEGEVVEVHHEPDPHAAKIVLKAMADAAKVLGLQKLRVEHTGANGGAIQAEIDWTRLTDEQIHKIRNGDFSAIHALAGAANGYGGNGGSPSQADEEGEPPQTH